MEMKHFKVDIRMLSVSQIFIIKGNHCCFTDYVNKKNHVGMHSDIYQPICFNVSVMMVITEICNFISKKYFNIGLHLSIC